jgi:uncharacterized protein (DUF1778 family)
MLDAASASAEEVLTNEASTTVPSAFFDDLWSALGKRPKANPALVKRATARRRVSQR